MNEAEYWVAMAMSMKLTEQEERKGRFDFDVSCIQARMLADVIAYAMVCYLNEPRTSKWAGLLTPAAIRAVFLLSSRSLSEAPRDKVLSMGVAL